MSLQPVELLSCFASTPVGASMQSAAAAVRAGVTRVGEHVSLVDRRGKPVVSAAVEGVEGMRAGDRAVELVTRPFSELLGALGGYADPVPVLLSFPEARPGWDEGDDRAVSQALSRLAANQNVKASIRCGGRGHAGVFEALKVAVELVANRAAKACVVGGVDSYLDPRTLGWLDSQRRRRAAYVRSGFVPGEAAAFVLVGAPELRHELRCTTLARVRGVHVARERVTVSENEEVLGEGLSSAVRGAARGVVTASTLVDDIYCDLNGERYRADEWGFALLSTQQWLRDGTKYVAPAGSWGDVGAASGALMMGLATEASQRGYARGRLAMAWASSDGGLRGAAVIEREVQ